MPGSRYCVLHQSWGFNIVASCFTLILGAVLGVLADDLYRRFVPSPESRRIYELQKTYEKSQQKPAFQLYFNDLLVDDGSIVITPTTNTSQRWRFSVRDIGTLPADKLVLDVQLHDPTTNVLTTGKWTTPAALTVTGDRLAAGSNRIFVNTADKLLVQQQFFTFEDLLLNQRVAAPTSFPLLVRISAQASDLHTINLILVYVPGEGTAIVTKPTANTTK